MMASVARELRKAFWAQAQLTSTHMRRSYVTKSGAFTKPTVDPEEVAKFTAMAADWWDPRGHAAALHRLNPVRLSHIRSAIERHATSASATRENVAPAERKPLSGFDVIDVGCGGLFS